MISAQILVFVLLTLGQADFKGKPIVKDGLIRASKDRGSEKTLVPGIRSQGVDFLVTPEVEAELKAKGVKQAVILAAKENYRLASGKRASYLTVTSNIVATSFNIDGVGSFVGDRSDFPIQPGIYRITARRSGYTTETQTIDLSSPGARRTLPFNLKPMSVSQLWMEAEGAFKLRDYLTVENNCREILQREPTNAKASVLLGQAYYARGLFDQALDPFVKGITGGQPAVFSGARGKGGSWAGVSLSPGRFVLRATALAFISGEKDDFDVPYAKIEDLKVGQSESVFMNVRVPKSGGKGEEKKEFKFYPTTAQPAVAMGRLVTCNCLAESNFVVRLISELRVTAK